MTTTASPSTTRRGFRLRRVPWDLAAASVVAAFVILALVWPDLLALRDPTALDLPAALQAPSPAHPFGTDEQGRDLYSRIVHGTRLSLLIGVGATVVSLSLAVVLGTLAALGPRALRVLVDRLVEVLFSFPSLLLALLIIAVTGPSALAQAVAVGIGTAPGYARMIRGQILQVKDSPYVESARALGHPPGRILLQHIVPNSLKPLVAIVALSIGQSIVWASSLAFLGLGVAPPSPEWGALLDAGKVYLTSAWWLTVIPGLVIVALALAATTIGEHLQRIVERGES